MENVGMSVSFNSFLMTPYMNNAAWDLKIRKEDFEVYEENL